MSRAVDRPPRTAPRFGPALLACALLAGGARAQERVLWIDTQAQFEPGQSTSRFAEAIPRIVAEMDAHGVSHTFLVPPPQPPAGTLPQAHIGFRYDAPELLAAIGPHRARFRVLGGGDVLNSLILSTSPGRVDERDRARLRAAAERLLAAGAIGLGEVTSSHYALPWMFRNHPYEATAPDHPLLLELADIAAGRDVPIDIHFGVVPARMPLPDHLSAAPSNPSVLEANLEGFERFLAHNRKARIVWSHAGSDPGQQRTVALMRGLLERHPNLYMSIRLVQAGPLPLTPLDAEGRLRPEWRRLLEDFRDRFVFQTDRFYRIGEPMLAFGPIHGFALTRQLLDQLPADLQRQLARDNVRRIYRMGD